MVYVPGNQVCIGKRTLVWTVLETYQDRGEQCLVIATSTQVTRHVELARNCRPAPKAEVAA